MPNRIESKGCSLAYQVAGSGEPVVFVQGVGLHGDGWLPQTQVLSADYRCITFDNRGMGLSQPVGVKLTIKQMAEDTLSVMDAEGVGAAHLIGHSMGGAIVLQVALMAPDRVRSLSLLCTSARGSDATRLTLSMMWLGMRSRIGSRRSRARAFLEIVMPSQYLAGEDRDALAERLKPLFGHDLASTPPIVMRQLGALKRFDATGGLHTLAVPTLVLSAEQDLIFPPERGRLLAKSIPGARYVEMAEAAHGVTIQCAEIVNQHLREHLDSVRQ